jgi:hypothetical protein
MVCRIGTLVLVLPVLVAAQATVEYAGGAAHSVGAAGASKAGGKSIAGALQKLGDKAESEANSKSPPRTAAPSRPAARATAHAAETSAKPKEPAPTYEDPAGIEAGMDGPTLLKRFGPPVLQLSDGSEETLSYDTKDGRSVDVKLANGKVTAVRKSGDTPATAHVPCVCLTDLLRGLDDVWIVLS